jgi:transposase
MAKKYVTLSPDEVLTLESGLKNHTCSRVRTRFHALLLSHQGQSAEQIAAVLFVSLPSVYNWLCGWEKKGIMGLLTRKGQGRRSILALSDHALVKGKLQANCQQLKVVREELKRELKKEFSQRTLKRFLKSLVGVGNV